MASLPIPVAVSVVSYIGPVAANQGLFRTNKFWRSVASSEGVASLLHSCYFSASSSSEAASAFNPGSASSAFFGAESATASSSYAAAQPSPAASLVASDFGANPALTAEIWHHLRYMQEYLSTHVGYPVLERTRVGVAPSATAIEKFIGRRVPPPPSSSSFSFSSSPPATSGGSTSEDPDGSDSRATTAATLASAAATTSGRENNDNDDDEQQQARKNQRRAVWNSLPLDVRILLQFCHEGSCPYPLFSPFGGCAFSYQVADSVQLGSLQENFVSHDQLLLQVMRVPAAPVVGVTDTSAQQQQQTQRICLGDAIFPIGHFGGRCQLCVVRADVPGSSVAAATVRRMFGIRDGGNDDATLLQPGSLVLRSGMLEGGGALCAFPIAPSILTFLRHTASSLRTGQIGIRVWESVSVPRSALYRTRQRNDNTGEEDDNDDGGGDDDDENNEGDVAREAGGGAALASATIHPNVISAFPRYITTKDSSPVPASAYKAVTPTIAGDIHVEVGVAFMPSRSRALAREWNVPLPSSNHKGSDADEESEEEEEDGNHDSASSTTTARRQPSSPSLPAEKKRLSSLFFAYSIRIYRTISPKQDNDSSNLLVPPRSLTPRLTHRVWRIYHTEQQRISGQPADTVSGPGVIGMHPELLPLRPDLVADPEARERSCVGNDQQPIDGVFQYESGTQVPAARGGSMEGEFMFEMLDSMSGAAVGAPVPVAVPNFKTEWKLGSDGKVWVF